MERQQQRIYFEISCVLPPGVTAIDFMSYVVREVRAGIGVLHPIEALAAFDKSSLRIRVKRYFGS